MNQCSLCERRFSRKADLAQHYNQLHPYLKLIIFGMKSEIWVIFYKLREVDDNSDKSEGMCDDRSKRMDDGSNENNDDRSDENNDDKSDENVDGRSNENVNDGFNETDSGTDTNVENN
ncbi:hypothetical protein GLOIN_2v1791547 [Rhizophagus irregularis DAOM 181602=DAOM 197198]|nr:hypothetical protein GLOIN_2v1791547 [Rhizophagus irregularis DAOM 181602=DAOM 197198]